MTKEVMFDRIHIEIWDIGTETTPDVKREVVNLYRAEPTGIQGYGLPEDRSLYSARIPDPVEQYTRGRGRFRRPDAVIRGGLVRVKTPGERQIADTVFKLAVLRQLHSEGYIIIDEPQPVAQEACP